MALSLFIFEEVNAMARYVYNGPVMEFDICIVNNWQGTTQASTIGKARNNLAYQFKKKNNRLPNAKITLPGKIVEMEV